MQEIITQPAIWQNGERHILKKRYPNILILNGLYYDVFELPLNGNSANCVTKFFSEATHNPLFYVIPLDTGVAFYHQNGEENTTHYIHYVPSRFVNGDNTLICIEENAPVIDEDIRFATPYGITQHQAIRIKVPGANSMGILNNSNERSGLVLFSKSSQCRVIFDKQDPDGFREIVSGAIQYYDALHADVDMATLLGAPTHTYGNLTFSFALPQETFVRSI